VSRNVKRGSGWCIGWESDTAEFQALVGTDEWAVELAAGEFEDFCRLTNQLQATMAHMATELMDGERIACEAESKLIWLEAEGYPHAYGLRFILLTGRRSEGGWSAEVLPQLLQAMQTLQVF